MTHASYTPQHVAIKQTKPFHSFEVIASGEVYPHTDIVMASVTAHELRGRLYRVVPDPTARIGYKRLPIEPLHADIARRLLAIPPRKTEVKRCVPVFGR